MGRVKELMMEMEENPLSGVSEKLVSENLFDNQLIRSYIHENGTDELCFYTKDIAKVLPLKSIVEYIDSIVLKYYGDPDNEVVGWDSNFEDDVPGFHREGGGYMIPNNRHYYNNMYELLHNTGFVVNNEELEKEIVDALSYHIHLVEKDPYGLNDTEVRIVDWNIIKNKAMEMVREGQSIDEVIMAEKARLQYLRDDIYMAHYKLQIKDHLTLYRAVNYKEEKRPLLFKDLTSPPVQYTKNMRMSKKGDSVFYGAKNKETTLEEAIKEDNDSYTYIGKFETKHPLILLNLTDIPDRLTIYDQEQYYLFVFLRKFCEAVSEYVPDHDIIKYAPTQVITYYFRERLMHYEKDGSCHHIDGILYTSSKNGDKNAILFFDNETSAQHLDLKECELRHQGKTISTSTDIG